MTDAAAATAQPTTISPEAFHGLDPSKQGDYAQVARQDGNGSDFVLRSSLPAESKPGDTPADKPGDTAPNAFERTADGRIKFGTVEATEQELRDWLTQKGLDDARKATLPPTPQDYRAELPKGFQAPQGIEIKINQQDPALADLRNFAHKNGLSQSQFESILAIEASRLAKAEAAFQNARTGELGKLGNTATARVDAVQTFIRGIVGDELGNALRSSIFTAKHVEAWEALAKRFATQGHASFSQAHRDPSGPPGRLTDAEYDALPAAGKLSYAQQFNQSQFGHAAGKFSDTAR